MKLLLLPLLPISALVYGSYYGFYFPEEGLSASQFTLEPLVRTTYNHNSNDFTQGYEIFDGDLYETTGLYGKSKVKRLNPRTGAVSESYSINRKYFGEGCTIFDRKLYVLTWKSRKVLVFNLESSEFKPVQELKLPSKTTSGEFPAPKEGWGLTHDNDNLIMSDGTANLFFLDPQTLEIQNVIRVFERQGGMNRIVPRLNELEYIGDYIWANIWYDDRIVLIEPSSGRVKHEMMFRKYVKQVRGQITGRRKNDAVLNGIAYDPDTNTILITGKLWPTILEIENPFPKG